MTESKDALRERHFQEAQRLGWQFNDSVPHPGEGLGRKTVLQFKHPQIDSLCLFIGPRGGMKTGRSYRSSACHFWSETPTTQQAAESHGKTE